MGNFQIFSDVSSCIVPEYNYFPQRSLIYMNIYSRHPKNPPSLSIGGLLILKEITSGLLHTRTSNFSFISTKFSAFYQWNIQTDVKLL